jgi:PHD/YefM family antitoxin component YafN of YafNO toxin-antitoxin module
MKTIVLQISRVRRSLFDLFEKVVSGNALILIRHRNRDERAVLTSEAHLRSLEKRLESLEAGNGSSFRLFDSASLRVDPDQILERTRKEQRNLASKKHGKA